MAGSTAELDAKYASWDGAMSPMRTSYGKLFMWFFLVSDALTFSGFLCAYGFFRHNFEGEWPDPQAVFHHFPFLHGVHLPLMYVGLMTFILIMSSVTMVLAVEAGHRNYRKGVLIWMFLTIIGGFMFVGSQAWEWYNFIKGSDNGAILYNKEIYTYDVNHETHETNKTVLWYHGTKLTTEQSAAVISKGEPFYGANLQYNEYGHSAFADFFFFITGFHGFHVFSGVIINLCIFLMALNGYMKRVGHYEMVEKVGLYWHFVDLVWVFVFTFFYLL
jgi:cytochrome c oxidase subunit 3